MNLVDKEMQNYNLSLRLDRELKGCNLLGVAWSCLHSPQPERHPDRSANRQHSSYSHQGEKNAHLEVTFPWGSPEPGHLFVTTDIWIISSEECSWPNGVKTHKLKAEDPYLITYHTTLGIPQLSSPYQQFPPSLFHALQMQPRDLTALIWLLSIIFS